MPRFIKRFLDKTPRHWKFLTAAMTAYFCYLVYLMYSVFSTASNQA